jgi:arsenate reductase
LNRPIAGALCEEAFFLAATHWIRLRPSLRWRFRPAVIIAMCDEVAEQRAPLFPGKSVFCQWNFLDPLATKAGDAEQVGALEQVFRQTLRRVSVLLCSHFTRRKRQSDL